MKKFASLLLIMSLGLFSVGAVTGCGGDKDKKKDAAPAKDAAKDGAAKDAAKDGAKDAPAKDAAKDS